jgi:DNA replication and repair protein RecF
MALTDFRSYQRLQFDLDGQSTFFIGPNGAGKTNLLEAVSLLSPGRGLRGASLSELGRQDGPGGEAKAWAVAATVRVGEMETRLGTGIDAPASTRRRARIDGQDAPLSRLADHVRPMWLTPAQDRLFQGGSTERRRFLDRLVLAAIPDHAAHSAAYERAQRERMRLLVAGGGDAAWLDALEAQAAKSGAAIASARAQTIQTLGAEIEARKAGAFPSAGLDLSGEWEKLALAGADEIEPRLALALKGSRALDAAAGRALIGPHRGDLVVIHGERGRPAWQCSTGEQKALVLGIILAQAARLSRAKTAPNPILLLDEVAAHLDRTRRAALFDEIETLSLQALLTGTDESLFETLRGRALGASVWESNLGPVND